MPAFISRIIPRVLLVCECVFQLPAQDQLPKHLTCHRRMHQFRRQHRQWRCNHLTVRWLTSLSMIAFGDLLSHVNEVDSRFDFWTSSYRCVQHDGHFVLSASSISEYPVWDTGALRPNINRRNRFFLTHGNFKPFAGRCIYRNDLHVSWCCTQMSSPKWLAAVNFPIFDSWRITR